MTNNTADSNRFATKNVHSMKQDGLAFTYLTKHHGWASWAPGYGWTKYGHGESGLQGACEAAFCYNHNC